MNWSKNRLANYKGVTFEYDASGKRTKKNNTPYVYVGDQLYKEGSMRYFYGSDGVAGFLAGGTKYYYQKNAQGDVIAIITCDGSGNNSVVATYVYDAFGNHKVYDANGNENFDEYFIGNINPIRYRSYYYDIETGLYYLKARYYDPKIGRFISPDSTKYLDPETLGCLNLYAYCNNNPVMYSDPSGNFFITAMIIGAIIGASIGFGATAYADYLDDGKIFNGSISVGDYISNTLVGGIIGGLVGGIGASSFNLTLPTFNLVSTSIGTNAIVVGTTSVTISGTSILAGIGVFSSLALFASNNRPGNNKTQNKQYNDAARKAGLNPNDPYTKDLLRRVHSYIRAHNLNLGWKELVKLIKEFL